MHRLRLIILGALLVFCVGVLAQPVPAATTASDFCHSELFARMVRVNTRLNTYTGRVHLLFSMHSFPFLSSNLDGSVYFKRPDQSVIIFDSVPVMASAFKKVFPSLEPPEKWQQLYTISLLRDTNGISMIRLIPLKNGRIDHLDVTADDVTALPTGYTYSYRDGGYIHFDETFSQHQGFVVPATLRGHIELPSMTADATSNFGEYKLNVPVDNAVFNQNS